LFNSTQEFEACANSIEELNKKLKGLTKTKETYSIKNKKIKEFKFKGIQGLIFNSQEGQLNTGLMMKNLIEYAYGLGIIILNSVMVKAINDHTKQVKLETNCGEIICDKLIVATNGFAKQLLNIKDVEPARAQVLVTKPIKNLAIKGTFHFDEGYYYFRNIDDRILFGGGRNLDFKTETTSVFELNTTIQNQLINKLQTTILPTTKFEVDKQWCGIMGIGSEKMPIVAQLSTNIWCAVRMGGMGVAIGSIVGKIISEKIT
jgi:gamma-glutamylputrescine oxidase